MRNFPKPLPLDQQILKGTTGKTLATLLLIGLTLTGCDENVPFNPVIERPAPIPPKFTPDTLVQDFAPLVVGNQWEYSIVIHSSGGAFPSQNTDSRYRKTYTVTGKQIQGDVTYYSLLRQVTEDSITRDTTLTCRETRDSVHCDDKTSYWEYMEGITATPFFSVHAIQARFQFVERAGENHFRIDTAGGLWENDLGMVKLQIGRNGGMGNPSQLTTVQLVSFNGRPVQ